MTEQRTPQTKTARQARIVELITRQSVRSQTELVQLLAAEGVVVTQGTLSKDLVDVGAVRVRQGDGDLGYALLAAERASDSTATVRTGPWRRPRPVAPSRCRSAPSAPGRLGQTRHARSDYATPQPGWPCAPA